MAVDERLDRLSGQLSKQSLGPVDMVLTEAMARVGSASSSLALGCGRPLMINL